MRIVPVLLLAGACAACVACSPRGVAESALLGDHFNRATDLRYGPGPRQSLDVYSPRARGEPAPVVIFLHGGRWQEGSRADYRLLGDAFTRRGIVLVIPDYRLYPAVTFPAWVEDAALAVRWAYANASSFGGDTSRVIVVGHSAGAHTATLLALDPRYFADAGVRDGWVDGVVSMAGPVATTWTDADVQALMGPPAGWPATYPRTHVPGPHPPLLLLHGTADEIVSPRNSTLLAEELVAAGGCARAVAYPRVGHIRIIVAAAAPWLGSAAILKDIVAFVRDPSSICRPVAP